MLKHTLLLALLALLASRAMANNCDAIRADIDARVRKNGISNHSLSVVDRAASGPGRVVGNCDQGSKKILMTQPGPASPATPGAPASPGTPATPAAPATTPGSAAKSGPSQTVPNRRDPKHNRRTDDILTECRDGSIVTGPDCSKANSANPAAPAAASRPKP